MSAPKRVLVPFATGTEDMEMVILTDVLSRAGIEVVRAAADPGPVALHHGTRVMPDVTLHQAREQRFDLVALPGGWSGAQKLDADPDLAFILDRCKRERVPVGAVCSAPNVLRRHGFMGDDTPFTAHPDTLGFATGGAAEPDRATVTTALLITGRSAGHTLDWALELVASLLGADARDQVRASLALLP